MEDALLWGRLIWLMYVGMPACRNAGLYQRHVCMHVNTHIHSYMCFVDVFLYVYTCIHMYISIHTQMYTHIYAYTHTDTHTRMYIHACMYMHIQMYILSIHTYTCICVYIHTYIYIYMYVFIYICTCIYIHIYIYISYTCLHVFLIHAWREGLQTGSWVMRRLQLSRWQDSYAEQKLLLWASVGWNGVRLGHPY